MRLNNNQNMHRLPPFTIYLLLLLALLMVLWLTGLCWFANKVATTNNTPQQSDAIVILTGGSNRLTAGLELFAQGKAKEIFISGVGQGVTTTTLLAGLPQTLTTPAITDHITLGHQAKNTQQNAEEVLNWMEQQQLQSAIIVTANYHMPRSMLAFDKHNHPFSFTSYPVLPDGFYIDQWWKHLDSLKLLMLEYHKYILRQLKR